MEPETIRRCNSIKGSRLWGQEDHSSLLAAAPETGLQGCVRPHYLIWKWCPRPACGSATPWYWGFCAARPGLPSSSQMCSSSVRNTMCFHSGFHLSQRQLPHRDTSVRSTPHASTKAGNLPQCWTRSPPHPSGTMKMIFGMIFHGVCLIKKCDLRTYIFKKKKKEGTPPLPCWLPLFPLLSQHSPFFTLITWHLSHSRAIEIILKYSIWKFSDSFSNSILIDGCLTETRI